MNQVPCQVGKLKSVINLDWPGHTRSCEPMEQPKSSNWQLRRISGAIIAQQDHLDIYGHQSEAMIKSLPNIIKIYAAKQRHECWKQVQLIPFNFCMRDSIDSIVVRRLVQPKYLYSRSHYRSIRFYIVFLIAKKILQRTFRCLKIMTA